MVRLAVYGGLSCAAAAYVVLSAFRQRSNFFAAAVYLSKSNASMMLLWNFGIFLTILFGRAMQTVFFGPLRLIEVERMHERVWYAITESLLALTIFRESFDTSFVILFVSLLLLKVFHWLASDRVEMMEQAPVIPRLFHIRMVTILSILWLVDIVLVAVAADSILTEGPSVMIMFASEYMILLATLVGTSLKYGANAYDLRGEVPWENKSVFIFYVELACDFLKLATYLCFFSLILTFYGLPLNILRDVYITARSFINKIRDLSRYRQATRNMDQRYPNATAEEMERLSDKTCIICREDMEARSEAQNQARDSRSGPNDTPKKLPCGHIFHFHCLRSWLERQQSCPTCRRPVLLAASSGSTGRQPAAPPPPAPAQAPGAQPARPQPAGAQLSPAPTGQPSIPPLQTNGHLAVPSSSQHRPVSPIPSSRRRAGPENPLVAFQLRSAPKPPLDPSNSTSNNANKDVRDVVPASAPGSSTEAAEKTDSSAAAVDRTLPQSQSNEALSDRQAVLPDSETTSIPNEMNSLERQRRERLDAMLRRRGFKLSESSSQPDIPAVTVSPDSTAPKPTPTIKVEDRAIGTLRSQEQSSNTSAGSNDGISRLSDTSTSGPSPLKPLLSSQLTPLESRASSPVTILDPMGAFGGPSSTPAVAPGISKPFSSSPEQSGSQRGSLPLSASPIPTLLPSLPSLDSGEMPRLIPLFDPLDPSKPNYLTRFIPSLLQSGLWPASQQSSQQQNSRPDTVHLPEDLDEGQLATLAEVTREGLETRLRLLSSTQSTLASCIAQLQKAMKAVDAGDLQGVLQTVSELTAHNSDQTDEIPIDSENKGKGKATEST